MQLYLLVRPRAGAATCRSRTYVGTTLEVGGVAVVDACRRGGVVGVALYAGIVAWCVWQLPATLPFVAPAAVAGLALHGVKGRPWWGLLAFAVLVVALPVLLAPALGSGAFSDLAGWIDEPQW